MDNKIIIKEVIINQEPFTHKINKFNKKEKPFYNKKILIYVNKNFT